MGEAKRRKQKDSSYGKINGKIITLYPKDNTIDIYDDPNILVGSSGEVVSGSYKPTEAEIVNLSGEIRRQIKESDRGWQIRHKGSRLPMLMLLNPPGRFPPVIIHSFSDRKYHWELDENFLQWSFTPSVPNIQIEGTPPEEWKAPQVINEMRHWPTIQTTHGKNDDFKELVARMRGHYHGLSLWQEFRVLRRGDLESVVLETPIKTMLPFADFDKALLAFTDMLWEKKVPMALRATSREHLWFCAAYSLMLCKKIGCGLNSREVLRGQDPLRDALVSHRANTKDLVYHDLSDMIARRRKALTLIEKSRKRKQVLKTESDLMLLNFETLQAQNCDWREWIVWLLIDEAIKYAWAEDDEKLIGYCREFLTSYSHYNRIINGKEKDKDEHSDSSTYVCTYLDQNQKLRISEQHRRNLQM
jgi:hypothetical protein